MRSQPGTAAGSLLALLTAAVGLAAAFGFTLTTLQRDAIVAFATAVIAVAPLVGALFDHARASAAARVQAAAVIAHGQTVIPPRPAPPYVRNEDGSWTRSWDGATGSFGPDGFQAA